ncbi:MAG TPA: peptidoglycan-binding protein [Nodularia sp. (in: cyanobacteria)]|nr:peptidoglycan-binding protein [Nodularia sp. (in: cyanobacteria)]
MDNIAYLYLADAYENSASCELISLSDLLNKASAPDWKRLSSRAWKYMLPLALALSILSSVTSVLALERGDQGPSVRNLQEQLQQAGFYQAPITQLYDFSTEDAVRRFQEAYGLPVDGIVGVTTRQTLETWPTQQASNQAPRQSNNPQLPQLSTASTPFATINYGNPQLPRPNTVKTQRTRPNSQLLQLGDQGEEVKTLQQRLRVAGFYSSQVTGVFSPMTEEAVKQFQQAYKLDVDGIVGPATTRKLPPVGVGGKETPTYLQTVNTDNLSTGNSGEAVRLLQQHLIQVGYLNGTADGYFGSQTADAVSRFQAANYLTASGIAGPTTRAKLYSLINTASQSEFSIWEIQRRLQEKGFYQGNLSGVMAEDTKRAIKKAQEFYGISLSDIRGGRF